MDGNGSFQVAWPTIGQQPAVIPGSPRMLGLKGASVLPRQGALVERHSGKLNVIWADGHASAKGLDQLTESALAGTTKNAYRFFTIEDD